MMQLQPETSREESSRQMQMPNKEAQLQLKRNLSDQSWRLNNLYWIVDENGVQIQFKLNWCQKYLLGAMWFWTLILKARQIGSTTFWCIFALDTCLFRPNTHAATIANRKETATRIFDDKVRYAYEHLPAYVHEMVKAKTESKTELKFSNGSHYYVDVNPRGGTLQILHITEFGDLCAKRPDRANDLVSGAFPTIHSDALVVIESNAEGREGLFYDFCDKAMKLQKQKAELTQKDWKFFFFPWWQEPSYRMPAEGIVIYQAENDYFERIEAKHEVPSLDMEQKAWYVKTLRTLAEDRMKRQYPSYAEEAFEASIEGAYYASQFQRIYQEKRITRVPHQTGIAVDTWWDLGMDDSMSIWFTQDVGREIHVLSYYENHGEGFEHYIKVLTDYRSDRGYHYGRHVAPWDITVREMVSGKTRLKAAAEAGLRFQVAPKVNNVLDGIELVRRILAICWFDEQNCVQRFGSNEVGVPSLENYRKEWNEKLVVYRDTPLHNWASHGADAFRTLAVAHDFLPKASGAQQRIHGRARMTRRGATV